jgi:drug/metabolite transporter (DMT)-like permease
LSFGLIKDRLAGLDPTALGAVRIAFATLVFLPFFRPAKIAPRRLLAFAAIGAVQFGGMYVLYMAAFRHLAAYEVALFTIFTPLWLALLDAAVTRRVTATLPLAVLLAVAGTAVACWQTLTTPRSQDMLAGFVLVQASNLCFALGQFFYRRVRATVPAQVSNASLFAGLYIGALAVTLLVSAFATDWARFHPTPSQWGVLAYLGVVASGLSFFWWNIGATRVGVATLAVFNNAKIPLGVACSVVIFGESAHYARLLAGCALLVVAIVIAERGALTRSP